jgi:quercetin dioxygenase-like cupin family protein
LARSGDVVENPTTRERFVWRKVARETDGELLQVDLHVAPGGFAGAEHVHPKQVERFEVLVGTILLRLDGHEKTLRVGDVALVPAGRPHVWRNGGEEELHALVEFRPALRTEMFFETMFGLARDVKTNRQGLPNLVRLSVVMREYSDEIRPARIPYVIQVALLGSLAAIGRSIGYRGWYSKYSAEPLTKPPTL